MKELIPIMALMIPIVAILSALVIRPWMRMHYESIARSRMTMSGDEQQAMEDLQQLAERMEMRLTTLERILDAEAPGWRERT
jgi:phage shock protein B